MRLDPK